MQSPSIQSIPSVPLTEQNDTTLKQKQLEVMDLIYRQLKYMFEYHVLGQNKCILANLNAYDELRKTIADNFSRLSSESDEVKLKEMIRCINDHTSSLLENNVFDELNKIANLFKSPQNGLLIKEIGDILDSSDDSVTSEIVKMVLECNFKPNTEDVIMEYCAEKSKKDIDSILAKIESEIYRANSQYDKLVSELIDIYVDKELPEKDKFAKITCILSSHLRKNSARWQKIMKRKYSDLDLSSDSDSDSDSSE